MRDPTESHHPQPTWTSQPGAPAEHPAVPSGCASGTVPQYEWTKDRGPVRRHHVDAPGSPVSPLQILEQRDVQRLLGHVLLQPAVLLLQSLQPLRLVLLQGAVLDPPTIERLLADPQPLARLRNRQPLRLMALALAQLRHDLLHAETLRRHASPPIWLSKLTGPSDALDQIEGGRTRPFPGEAAAGVGASGVLGRGSAPLERALRAGGGRVRVAA